MKRSCSCFIAFIIFILAACNNEKEKVTKVILHYKPVMRETILVERLSYDEKTRVIDSAILEPGKEITILQFPVEEQRIFRLRIRNNPARIYFINDVPVVNIYTRNGDLMKYYFSDSTANGPLRSFLDEQDGLAIRANQLERNKDSLANVGVSQAIKDSISGTMDSLRSLIRQRDLAFADTTSNAGVFLFLNNRIDFGRDLKGLKTYITSATTRFPGHKDIQRLADETLKFIRIHEEEYKIGDKAPDLVLTDQLDMPFSLYSLSGKYVFIDFWATWCPQCMVYTDVKKRLKQRFPDTKFETVSIALDPEKDPWKREIYKNSLPGVQLIDERIWKGKAVEAFKIDSIPFNFLISPQGIILAKAIKKDSVWQVVSGVVK